MRFRPESSRLGPGEGLDARLRRRAQGLAKDGIPVRLSLRLAGFRVARVCLLELFLYRQGRRVRTTTYANLLLASFGAVALVAGSL